MGWVGLNCSRQGIFGTVSQTTPRYPQAGATHRQLAPQHIQSGWVRRFATVGSEYGPWANFGGQMFPQLQERPGGDPKRRWSAFRREETDACAGQFCMSQTCTKRKARPLKSKHGSRARKRAGTEPESHTRSGCTEVTLIDDLLGAAPCQQKSVMLAPCKSL